jgi:hypothetical protein
MASKLLAGARSYMKCEERDDAADVCARQYNPKNPKSNLSRYCPPNTNVRCQMARWTFQGKNNHEDFVAGFMEGGFEKYGISPQALMENSWKYYQNNRGGKRDYREVLDKHNLNSRDELLHIPICVSSVKTIEDIWPNDWNFETNHWRKGFPFSCGNHTSDESPSFLNDININPFKEHELWHNTLPKVCIALSRVLVHHTNLCYSTWIAYLKPLQPGPTTYSAASALVGLFGNPRLDGLIRWIGSTQTLPILDAPNSVT